MESKAVRCGLLSLICGLSVFGVLKANIDVFGYSPSSNFAIFGFTMLFAIVWSVMFIYPKTLLIGIPAVLGGVAWLIFGVIGWERFDSYYLEYRISPYLKAIAEYPTIHAKELTIDFLILSFLFSIVICLFVARLQSNVVLWLFTAPSLLISVYPQILKTLGVGSASPRADMQIHYSVLAFIVLIIADAALIAFNLYEKRNYPKLYENVKSARHIIEILILVIVGIAVALIVLKYLLMAYILYNVIIFILYFIAIIFII
jgi:hypothetical protein